MALGALSVVDVQAKTEIMKFLDAKKDVAQAKLMFNIAKDNRITAHNNVAKAQHAALKSDIAYGNAETAVEHASHLFYTIKESLNKMKKNTVKRK